MKCERAVYQCAILPEDRGNPLIEALPPKVKDEIVIEKIGFFPSHSEDERSLPPLERSEYLRRLSSLRQPQPLHLEVFRAIEMAIKEGLSAKNPLSPTTMNYLSYPIDEPSSIAPSTGYFQPKGTGITIIGESGVGKTSMIEQVLNYFPDTIIHENYKGRVLPLRQVVWVKVDCPENSSVRALCHQIITELDHKLEYPPTTFSSTIDGLKTQIESRVKSCFLSILVIDEMQNLNLAKAGGDDRLIAFLHTLVNRLGVPLLFCANPPFNELLAKTLKTARRAESNGSFNVKLLDKGDDWNLFIDELWRLQWTDVSTPLTNLLSDKLYELSVGNMELAMRVYREAQRQIIGTGDERITPELLEYAASCAINICSDRVEDIRKKLKPSAFKRKTTSCAEQSNIANKPTKTVQNQKLVSVPIGLNRCHHPEFAEKLLELKEESELLSLIQDPDLIRSAMKSDNSLIELKKKTLYCDDPLSEYA